MFSPPLKKSIVFLKYALKMDLVKGAWFDLYVFMVYPVTIKTYMDIYVLCLDILYIFLSVVVLKKNMFNRLNINIFMIAGLLVGIVFEVLLNFGQASMSDYFNLKAFLLFIILQVSLINAGNYLLKTF